MRSHDTAGDRPMRSTRRTFLSRRKAAEARREAWFERHPKKAPPITWEQWAAANAALGIKVKRREAA
ncbi:hypothetical protein GA0070624_3626 [Micromonospora rhizosphaerae]|uniref:Uncharacterized protein n=1 Tax=Micromonospora rhizosphaerae TaxID=568872 RepID=A0A1C6SF29_9ACTN|nr:hypothetical protein [Micromonospora rhizosphaerae]SCL28096.1 hypothetical protein GA0070624_3626 [Micromonospora rhizosphaerae]